VPVLTGEDVSAHTEKQSPDRNFVRRFLNTVPYWSVGQASCLSKDDRQDACPTKTRNESRLTTRDSVYLSGDGPNALIFSTKSVTT
jgi:hypothetical protein